MRAFERCRHLPNSRFVTALAVINATLSCSSRIVSATFLAFFFLNWLCSLITAEAAMAALLFLTIFSVALDLMTA